MEAADFLALTHIYRYLYGYDRDNFLEVFCYLRKLDYFMVVGAIDGMEDSQTKLKRLVKFQQQLVSGLKDIQKQVKQVILAKNDIDNEILELMSHSQAEEIKLSNGSCLIKRQLSKVGPLTKSSILSALRTFFSDQPTAIQDCWQIIQQSRPVRQETKLVWVHGK